MVHENTITKPHDSLVDYIARHAQVQSYNGSLQKHEHGYEMASRVIGDYNLLYVTRGRVVWVVNNEPIELVPQSLLMVPPGPRHHAYALTKRVTILSIHLNVTLPGRVDVLELLNPQPLLQVSKNSRLDRYMCSLMTEYQGYSICPRQDLLPGWTNLIAHEFIDVMAQARKLSSEMPDPMISQLLERLNKHFADALTLEQIAAWAGYTPQHTNRLFKQILGVTPLKYLMQLRMNKAAALLAENVLAIHAIGQQVGFDDPYYFSRMFRQYHGQSPQQYQQSVCSEYPSRISTSPLG